MNKTKIFLNIALCFFLSQGALALENKIGNGGGVVICTLPSGEKTTEVLDVYEGRESRGLQSNLGDPNEDFMLKIDRALNKLSRIAPYRSTTYRKLFNTFFSETKFLSGVNLIYIPDTGAVSLKKGCVLEQAAYQKEPSFEETKRYFISQDLWDVMDNNSKAALILHEIVYREAISLEQNTSVAVRYLNSYITSTQIDTMTQREFVHKLFLSGFKFADYWGNVGQIKLSDISENKLYIQQIRDLEEVTPFFKDIQIPSITEGDNGIKLTTGEFAFSQDKEDLSIRGVRKISNMFGVTLFEIFDSADHSGHISFINAKVTLSSWAKFKLELPSFILNFHTTLYDFNSGFPTSDFRTSNLVEIKDGKTLQSQGFVSRTDKISGYVGPRLFTGQYSYWCLNPNPNGNCIYENGILKGGYMDMRSGKPAQLKTYQGMKTSCVPATWNYKEGDPDMGKYLFDENENAKVACIAAEQSITTVDQQVVQLSTDTIVEFTSQGAIIKGYPIEEQLSWKLAASKH
ncbi:MAG: hypothetical protein V4654_01625 [Bdellovibrionota bacterium]